MRISDWSSDVCSSDLREVFLGSCSYCHTVRGTNATSDFGPDLTHLASRRTIAAGLLPNTVGDLAGWILDPQRHKPGNALPSMQLEPDALPDLLTSLETPAARSRRPLRHPPPPHRSVRRGTRRGGGPPAIGLAPCSD